MIPFDWNVVINGSWNRAILTPNGIATRIFQIPEGTPISVLVDLERLNPALVKFEGHTVSVHERRLIIGTEVCDLDNMMVMLKYGRNAISSLPETPFKSAGFNIRYQCNMDESSVLSKTLLQPIDSLSDAGYAFESHGFQKGIKYKDGRINLIADTGSRSETGYLILMNLNFHRESTNREMLLSWLDIGSAEIDLELDKIQKALGVSFVKETNRV